MVKYQSRQKLLPVPARRGTNPARFPVQSAFYQKAVCKPAKTWYTDKQNPHSPDLNACVAQLVEQRIRNAQVAGSSPATSSKKARRFV